MKTSNRARPFRLTAVGVVLAIAACNRAPERDAESASGSTGNPAAEQPSQSPALATPNLYAPETKTKGDARSAGQAPEAELLVAESVNGAPEPMPASSAGVPVETARRARSAAQPSKLGAFAGGVLAARKSASVMAPTDAPSFDGEGYAEREDAAFARVSDAPLSTFSIDVDTASYANVRRFLQQGQLPPAGAVRIEELVNYFPYAYPDPAPDAPMRVITELSAAPWNPEHQLLLVGVQGKRIETAALPPRNLVFLLDVSGSMESPNKLPLLKHSLEALTETLRESDRVAIVVYAGASGLVLPPTSGDRKAEILAALDRLEAGGSTNGGAGLELAYSVAQQLQRPGATTRVVLATDGDFNVGPSSEDALSRLIEHKRDSGVFLSVLGFGMGNYKDSTLELLANRGNGNYAYVDSLAEARKVLVAEGGATLVTLAQDVKLQLEFNPAKVGAYRLIGYENRRLEAQDFNDDRKDAGELGAGHRVTALYELVPPGKESGSVDPSRYRGAAPSLPGHESELGVIKLRYKAPGARESQLIEQTFAEATSALGSTSPAFRFAAGVAAFGMTLRQSPERGSSSFALARELAQGAIGKDLDGYQRELIGLIDTAARLRGSAPALGAPLAMP
jgi:Ca-activated chloride channel family protein